MKNDKLQVVKISDLAAKHIKERDDRREAQGQNRLYFYVEGNASPGRCNDSYERYKLGSEPIFHEDIITWLKNAENPDRDENIKIYQQKKNDFFDFFKVMYGIEFQGENIKDFIGQQPGMSIDDFYFWTGMSRKNYVVIELLKYCRKIGMKSQSIGNMSKFLEPEHKKLEDFGKINNRNADLAVGRIFRELSQQYRNSYFQLPLEAKEKELPYYLTNDLQNKISWQLPKFRQQMEELFGQNETSWYMRIKLYFYGTEKDYNFDNHNQSEEKYLLLIRNLCREIFTRCKSEKEMKFVRADLEESVCVDQQAKDIADEIFNKEKAELKRINTPVQRKITPFSYKRGIEDKLI